MSANRPGEKRRARRFEIDCPVTVGLRRKGNGQAVGQGRLHDVAVRGARFYLSRPLEIGSSVVLQIHFRDLNESVTTVRFEGNLEDHTRSEEHTSELQSQSNLVCRLLLEKKKKTKKHKRLLYI